ncbi:antileukoproteinase-like [Budorcas taxicolor]|uniref:antileukoproteinase-like n=1 Tax=Budorcas taxicolor TaxID=37181 RepID=UPI0022837EBB|nr:antileukoproteinase-like [Budorcas taxicolor]
MKSSSLIVFLVIFAFGFLMPWTVEGAPKRELDFLRPYPEKGKPGACPFVRPVPCFVYEPPECQSDWQCPKRQKCCQGLCGIKCTDPVDTSKPVTPGKCPVVTGHCERPNPVNICQDDSHCLNGFKCCRGPCGNSCVLPVKDSSFPGQKH